MPDAQPPGAEDDPAEEPEDDQAEEEDDHNAVDDPPYGASLHEQDGADRAEEDPQPESFNPREQPAHDWSVGRLRGAWHAAKGIDLLAGPVFRNDA